MKLSNKVKSLLKKDEFDLEYESRMAQSRILNTILEVVENRNMTQTELSEKTGLNQPFLSALFNLHKRLNMKHLALLQKALNIKLQSPKYFTEEEHLKMFYSDKEYIPATTQFIESDIFNEDFTSWIIDGRKKESNKDTYSLIETIPLKDPLKNDDKSLELLERENPFR